MTHDQPEDRRRIDGETSRSDSSGDRRKRSRETVMEVHENRVRQAHHSGESENLERDRETIMEVYESVPRHAQARHFKE